MNKSDIRDRREGHGRNPPRREWNCALVQRCADVVEERYILWGAIGACFRTDKILEAKTRGPFPPLGSNPQIMVGSDEI